jgi:hypothetical protein
MVFRPELTHIIHIYIAYTGHIRVHATSPSVMKKLTRSEIVETTGVSTLESLVELEVLFTTCHELEAGALSDCVNLKRLALIDNGLQVISNLRPVAPTLISLCMCDQAITTMANLELPNLQELFLHRNLITRISGLHGCPRLKRLWLCQNKIKEISGLHSVPELQECYLQANEITRIGGFETNPCIQTLGLAGNMIADFEELHKLSAIPSSLPSPSSSSPALTNLSLVDVHFGRCPVAAEAGYKDFVLTYLPNIRVLDGVAVAKEHQQQAEAAYSVQLKAFDEALRTIEEEYRMDIQRVDQQLKVTCLAIMSFLPAILLIPFLLLLFLLVSRVPFKCSRKRDDGCNKVSCWFGGLCGLVICWRCLIYVDLSELQSLISEGREMITNQSRRQDEMTDRNLRLLDKRLLSSAEKVKESVDSALVVNTQEQDLTLAYFCLLERLAAAEATLMTVLCADNSSTSNSNNSVGTGSSRSARDMSSGQTRKGWVYQAVNAISPDHLHYESLLANSNSSSNNSNNNSNTINRVELLGMYRLLPNIGNHSIFMASSSSRQLMTASSRHRIDRVKVYTVVTAEEFRNLLLRSPQAWQSATVGKQPTTRLFCSHPG